MNTNSKGMCSHPCPCHGCIESENILHLWVRRMRISPELERTHEDHQVLSLPRTSLRISTMCLRELSKMKVKGRWWFWRNNQKKRKKKNKRD